jgi:hypothetical protein
MDWPWWNFFRGFDFSPGKMPGTLDRQLRRGSVNSVTVSMTINPGR